METLTQQEYIHLIATLEVFQERGLLNGETLLIEKLKRMADKDAQLKKEFLEIIASPDSSITLDESVELDESVTDCQHCTPVKGEHAQECPIRLENITKTEYPVGFSKL